MTLKFIITRKDPYQQILGKKSVELQKLLHLDARDVFQINLILDEISTNIFEHNPASLDLVITIEIIWKDNLLHMIFLDNGPAFDPSKAAMPDTKLPLEERQPGGLGLLLVKRYSECVAYERQNGYNRTTITKNIEQSHHSA